MAGGMIIVVGFIAILMIHEGGHLLAAKAFGIKATKYFLGFGPTIWSFQRGETEYGIKAIPAGGYVRIIGMNPLEEVPPEDEGRTYRSRPFLQKSVVVMAGVGTHFVMAFLLLWVANVLIGAPDPNKPLLSLVRIVPETADGSPSAAAQAGLQVGDRVFSVDGVPVATWNELTTILKLHPNQSVVLEVERDGGFLQIAADLTSRVDPETGVEQGFLGVSPGMAKSRDNPFEGVWVSAGQVVTLVQMSAEGLREFVTHFDDFIRAVFDSDEPLDEVRPVSVIGITQFGAVSQRAGFHVTLQLLAYVAVFVGMLNAVPLYPFDGGHFAVALYQKVTGREADVRKLMPVAVVVMGLMVLVGLLGLYFDIFRPLNLG